MENKFYNHHVIKHAALMLWHTIGLLDCKITSSRMSLKGRTGNGERARGKRKWRMGTKRHLILSSITNFITHSIFFYFIVFTFPFPALVPRSPFLVLVTWPLRTMPLLWLSLTYQERIKEEEQVWKYLETNYLWKRACIRDALSSPFILSWHA